MTTTLQHHAPDFFRERGFAGRVGFGSRPALLVVDIVNGFTDATMPLGAPAEAEIVQVNRLLDAAHAAALPVFLTTIQYDSPTLADAGVWAAKIKGLASLRAGTPVVEQDARLRRQDSDAIIVKKYASSFFGTDLMSRLHTAQVDTLIITGMTTSGCVRASAVDACQHGLRAIVVPQAVADRSPAAHAQALVDIETKYGDVMDIDQVLAHMARS